jgi:hypothetical protein
MATDYDKDKFETSLNQDSFNPGLIVGEIRKLVTHLREATDLVVKARSSKISDRRARICQDLLNAFETTLFAFDHDQKVGSLSNSHQREILVMVDDILKGKREYAHFQLTRNADGIKELFSDRVFLVNDQNKEQNK